MHMNHSYVKPHMSIYVTLPYPYAYPCKYIIHHILYTYINFSYASCMLSHTMSLSPSYWVNISAISHRPSQEDDGMYLPRSPWVHQPWGQGQPQPPGGLSPSRTRHGHSMGHGRKNTSARKKNSSLLFSDTKQGPWLQK